MRTRLHRLLNAFLNGLRRVDRLLDRIFDPLFNRASMAASERRWRQHNRKAYADGCPCGGPPQRVQVDRSNHGSVPVEYWTCNEHYGMSSWTRHLDEDGRVVRFEPHWRRPHPCEGCLYDPIFPGRLRTIVVPGEQRRMCGGYLGRRRPDGEMDVESYECPVRPATLMPGDNIGD